VEKLVTENDYEGELFESVNDPLLPASNDLFGEDQSYKVMVLSAPVWMRLSFHDGGEWCMQVAGTLPLERSSQYMKEVVMCEEIGERKCTFRVLTLSHSYIRAEGSNRPREMWLDPQRQLEMSWMAEIGLRRTPVR
jgi:hypothetical protein